ncbi:MAG: extracellular solute-binding protein [Hyphomicrobiales bacterium]
MFSFPAAQSQEAPAGGAPEAQTASKPDEIVVASWGGAYAQSQERAFFAPFGKESGISVRAVSHNGETTAAVLKDNAGNWDVVDLSAGAVKKACEDGLLVKLDHSRLAGSKDGAKAEEDYLPGAIGDCGVGSVAWSAIIAFDKRDYTRAEPAKAADLFDLKAFPGKRALPRDPRRLFELALSAAGVAPSDIYTTLASEEGIGKVLAELDKIRDEIVWWKRPGEALELLADGKAGFALAYNGRVFASIVGENQPFGVVWDGQVYDMDMWAIPRDSRHQDAAMQFIAFASGPERMAAQTRWFPYGPLRKSAVAMAGKHAEVDVEMKAFLPTAPDNFRTAIRYDASFWEQNGERIARRLDEWRNAKAEEDKAKDGEAAKQDEESGAEDGERKPPE